MRGAFEAKRVAEFVESIRRGYERVAPLAGGAGALPEAATVAPWDGLDGKAEVEDEFSLEELMGGGSGGDSGDKSDEEGGDEGKSEL